LAASIANQPLPVTENQWECTKCTFINTVEYWTDDHYSKCSVCGSLDVEIMMKIKKHKDDDLQRRIQQNSSVSQQTC